MSLTINKETTAQNLEGILGGVGAGVWRMMALVFFPTVLGSQGWSNSYHLGVTALRGPRVMG